MTHCHAYLHNSCQGRDSPFSPSATPAAVLSISGCPWYFVRYLCLDDNLQPLPAILPPEPNRPSWRTHSQGRDSPRSHPDAPSYQPHARLHSINTLHRSTTSTLHLRPWLGWARTLSRLLARCRLNSPACASRTSRPPSKMSTRL